MVAPFAPAMPLAEQLRIASNGLGAALHPAALATAMGDALLRTARSRRLGAARLLATLAPAVRHAVWCAACNTDCGLGAAPLLAARASAVRLAELCGAKG